jgi:hypothetical protein
MTMKNALFYLALATLFTHELDAMPNHEWRGMPVLGSLPDDVAMTWFVVLHVPLFAGLMALAATTTPRTRLVSRLVIGATTAWPRPRGRMCASSSTASLVTIAW